MFHLQCAHLFWKCGLVLYTVDSALYPFNPGQPLFPPPFALCLSVSLRPSPPLDSLLASHFIHMLHSSCLQPLNKDCLSCYFPLTPFPSPYTCHSRCILLIFVSPQVFFLLTLCFPLCLEYLSVRHTVKLQELQDSGFIPILILRRILNCSSSL